MKIKLSKVINGVLCYVSVGTEKFEWNYSMMVGMFSMAVITGMEAHDRTR
jgi:hypothetical protein